jgi:hypothetical protein
MTYLVNRMLQLIYGLVIGWLINLARLLNVLSEERQRKDRLRKDGEIYTKCQPIPPQVYKRPDPLIYSQSYLMSLGLGVTWDNPDIQLYEVTSSGTRGAPVSSHLLKAGRLYEIDATIYNGSTVAPAMDMPVEFSYLSFGIGTASNAIGTDKVNLPVKGAPGHPANAVIRWRTPREKGHYCIQVRLIWNDDANPLNNLGQENVDVGISASPAAYTFTVGNHDEGAKRIRFEADAYTLGELPECDPEFDPERYGNIRGRVLTEDEREAGRSLTQRRIRRHLRGSHAIPEGWKVIFSPEAVELKSGEEKSVTAKVTPPDGWTGRQTVNVHGFDNANRLIGGVTLHTIRE